jgi:hypothetical protein
MARVSTGIRLGVLCLALLLGAAGASRPGRPIADRSHSPSIRRAFSANAAFDVRATAPLTLPPPMSPLSRHLIFTMRSRPG